MLENGIYSLSVKNKVIHSNNGKLYLISLDRVSLGFRE